MWFCLKENVEQVTLKHCSFGIFQVLKLRVVFSWIGPQIYSKENTKKKNTSN